MFVICVCGVLLFSMSTIGNADAFAVGVIGYIGVVASIGGFITETYVSLKAQQRKMSGSESGQITEETLEIEDLVDECSWFYLTVSFILSSTYVASTLYYAITLNDAG